MHYIHFSFRVVALTSGLVINAFIMVGLLTSGLVSLTRSPAPETAGLQEALSLPGLHLPDL